MELFLLVLFLFAAFGGGLWLIAVIFTAIGDAMELLTKD